MSELSSSASYEQLTEIMEGPLSFVKQSQQIIHRCKKPDRREFWQIFQVVGVGFLIMGFIGFAVKLIHIPINNIIVGAA
ncbi:Sec61p translocation complex subunit [Coelomomyces lativittatus]|nr:Sec61p translocation complex subunit [Coelomomyces lativittatus]KAJ1514067.1 Sec61p translocation complex subunit [Coelomomyces lativittatus]